MSEPVVGIVMGSDSDWPMLEPAADTLAEFDVPYEVHVVSAHRTPRRMRVKHHLAVGVNCGAPDRHQLVDVGLLDLVAAKLDFDIGDVADQPAGAVAGPNLVDGHPRRDLDRSDARGVRWADTTCTSYGTSKSASVSAAGSSIGQSESLPMTMPTTGSSSCSSPRTSCGFSARRKTRTPGR